MVPLAPTPPTTQHTNPEPSTVRFDASSGTKISEEAQPSPQKPVQQNKSKATLIVSPIPRRVVSPIIKSQKVDGKSTERIDEDTLPESSSNTSLEVDPQPNREKSQGTSDPSSPQGSDNLLLDLTNLVAELHKAASDIVIEKAIQSNSINKSVQQASPQGTNKAIDEPIIERPATPFNKYSMNKEVVDSLLWLVNLLSNQIDDSVNHEEVENKMKVAAAHFHLHWIPDEAIPIESIPLLVKNLLNTYSNAQKCQNRAVDLGKDLKILDKSTTEYSQINDVEEQKKRLEAPLDRSKQGLSKIDTKLTAIAKQKKETEEHLATIKQEEKDERALYEKFVESQGATKQALEDLLTEYNS
ncbi:hypothetical protein PIB30_031966 [Stylosanthes scabra]|uniref:Uncharacterized protein n=1 Tax=Stylosanthes scabra TaxID=79078 RepID=A0ABU6TBN9_9FABA|nr:hypothetical protein [Stylosanthes scabra]